MKEIKIVLNDDKKENDNSLLEKKISALEDIIRRRLVNNEVIDEIKQLKRMISKSEASESFDKRLKELQNDLSRVFSLMQDNHQNMKNRIDGIPDTIKDKHMKMMDTFDDKTSKILQAMRNKPLENKPKIVERLVSQKPDNFIINVSGGGQKVIPYVA